MKLFFTSDQMMNTSTRDKENNRGQKYGYWYYYYYYLTWTSIVNIKLDTEIKNFSVNSTFHLSKIAFHSIFRHGSVIFENFLHLLSFSIFYFRSWQLSRHNYGIRHFSEKRHKVFQFRQSQTSKEKS